MQADAGRIDVPIHWQDTVEILLVQRGRLALRIGEAQFAGRPGDVFYINPRQLHGMQTPGPKAPIWPLCSRPAGCALPTATRPPSST